MVRFKYVISKFLYIKNSNVSIYYDKIKKSFTEAVFYPSGGCILRVFKKRVSNI